MQHGVTSALQQSRAKHWQANLSSVARVELQCYNYNMRGLRVKAGGSTCLWMPSILQCFTLLKDLTSACLKHKQEKCWCCWHAFERDELKKTKSILISGGFLGLSLGRFDNLIFCLDFKRILHRQRVKGCVGVPLLSNNYFEENKL